jgi:hypothetical protein
MSSQQVCEGFLSIGHLNVALPRAIQVGSPRMVGSKVDNDDVSIVVMIYKAIPIISTFTR